MYGEQKGEYAFFKSGFKGLAHGTSTKVSKTADELFQTWSYLVIFQLFNYKTKVVPITNLIY